MFTASSAPVTSRCRPRWSTIFCFRGPLRRSPRVCLRFFGPCFFLSACGPFGAARGAFFFRRVPLFLALPGPFSPSGPSLASRCSSGSASLASHLPADAGALLRSSARSARGAPLLRAGALASRSSPFCVSLAPRSGAASLVFLPLFFSCPPPKAASHFCPSSRSLCCRSGSQVPAFVFAFPAAFGGFFPCLRFSCLRLCLARRLWRPLFLPLFFSCLFSLGHSYGCFLDFFFFFLFLVRLSHGRGEGEGIE